MKLELLMKQAGLRISDRPVVHAACEKSEAYGGEPASAIELPNGKIVTGRTTDLLGSSSAMLLNALKELAGIPDEIHLIPPWFLSRCKSLKPSPWVAEIRDFTPMRYS